MTSPSGQTSGIIDDADLQQLLDVVESTALPGPASSSIGLSTDSNIPPAYSESLDRLEVSNPDDLWSTRDPRSSSTQSLVPGASGSDTGKRTLLLIYIHGFMGNEASFQSFPAHVHNLVGVKIGDTHVVHTKSYPRYKSRRPIEHARDDFSSW